MGDSCQGRDAGGFWSDVNLARGLHWPVPMTVGTVFRALVLAALASAIGPGCGGNHGGKSGDAGCSASGASCAATGCCQSPSDMCLASGTDKICENAIPLECDLPSSSNLPGVSIQFADAPCTFSLAQAAAGIHVAYQVVVAQSLSGVHPTPGDAGGCQEPDASGLIVGFSFDGNGQKYCRCDTGLCATTTFTTAPAAGAYDTTIAWDGRNWSGPSDTGNPEGAAFPVGTYQLTLTAIGTWDDPDAGSAGRSYTVTGTRSMVLTN